jgi:hypothetical protein
MELQNIITGFTLEVAELEDLVYIDRLDTGKLRRLRGRVGSLRLWLIALESFGLAVTLAQQYLSIGMRAPDGYMQAKIDDFVSTYDATVDRAA